MSDARINGDMRVTGNLSVNGSMPSIARSGLTQDANQVFSVPLSAFRVWDAIATNLPGTSANDDLGLAGGTFGTDGPKLTTGDLKAAGATTRYARAQLRLPPEYDDGETVTLRISGGMETTVSDTTATVDVEAYKVDREGSVGSDICATAATTINSLTFANVDFTITATGLAAGDLLDVRIAVAVNDAATGTAVIASLGAVELLLDIRG